MLILTRRIGESLIIGDDIKVTILGIKPHQIRIGIEAPKDVSVHREEIYLRIKDEKRRGSYFENEEDYEDQDSGDDRGNR